MPISFGYVIGSNYMHAFSSIDSGNFKGIMKV